VVATSGWRSPQQRAGVGPAEVPDACIVARTGFFACKGLRSPDDTEIESIQLGGKTMTTTTFGYHPGQDRIWMLVHDQHATVWLTRRLLIHILGPLRASFESATPGVEGGAPASTRAAIEHSLALHEGVAGRPPAQIRSGHVGPGEHLDPERGLCTRILTQSNEQSVVMTFETPAGPLVMRLDRKGTHLWLKGLVLVLRQTDWNLSDILPAWLRTGLMPGAIQALIGRPLPEDLDDA
jgi:hypothetical protein